MIISAGTTVSSYLLHFDPVGSPTVGLISTGSITFDTDILGLIFTGTALGNTDGVLGSATTTYTGTFNRALELVSPPPGTADIVTISADRRTLTFSLQTSTGQDHLRVVTAAVPEPNPALLLGMGVCCLLVLRRMRMVSPALDDAAELGVEVLAAGAQPIRLLRREQVPRPL